MHDYNDNTLIEKDHLGDRSPDKDCRQRPTPRQPVRKPSSESSEESSESLDSEDGPRTGRRNVSHQQQSPSVPPSPR